MAPSILTFAGQTVGTAGPTHTAVVKNIGTVPVDIIGIVSSGDFGEVHDLPVNISAGAVCTITVIFKPAATGIRSGTVSIFDAAGGSPPGS